MKDGAFRLVFDDFSVERQNDHMLGNRVAKVGEGNLKRFFDGKMYREFELVTAR
ncbi:MAG: hypothetical protein ABSE48_11270 [Verrucomicrobiota bacterium]